jgi:Flp pilus assembly protein TadD
MIAPRCVLCGTPLVGSRCLRCDSRHLARAVHRELVVLCVLIAITIAAFFLTRIAASANADVRRRDAAAWFLAAQRRPDNFAGGIPRVTELRHAVTKDPLNREYPLALARELATQRQDDEARRVLERLRQANPDDAETNLELARIEARRTSVDEARRYYQTALAALWRPDQNEQRRRVRLELVAFLLNHGERSRALSELLVVADVPPQPAVHVQLGSMFLQAGDASRARDHFLDALGLDPHNPDALVGAGAAAFALGDYPQAARYLDHVPSDQGRTTELRELTRLVVSGDPLEPRIGSPERRRRVTAALEQARATLDACLGVAPAARAPALLELRSAAVDATAAGARTTSPDFVEDGIELAYRMEAGAEQACGPATAAADRAVLLIGRRHGLDQS